MLIFTLMDITVYQGRHNHSFTVWEDLMVIFLHAAYDMLSIVSTSFLRKKCFTCEDLTFSKKQITNKKELYKVRCNNFLQ